METSAPEVAFDRVMVLGEAKYELGAGSAEQFNGVS
jgi:hypothetical protein